MKWFRDISFSLISYLSLDWYVTVWELTPLLVTCEWTYVLVNENGDCKNMKMLLNCFACYNQSEYWKHIYYIIIYSWHKVTHMWLVMEFPQISHTPSYYERLRDICTRSWYRFMVFNTTFNNISVISWRSVLLVEETRVPGENHRPVASHWHNVVSSEPRHERGSNSQL